jgi:HEAT repeat protein
VGSPLEPSLPRLCVGEGSEICFEGRIETAEITLQPDEGSRFCFRKVKGGWAYVWGRGHIEYTKDKKVVNPGSGRSLNSLVSLLSSADPIIREGAARELGHLVTETEVEPVVPKLTALLSDSAVWVRRGAAEGLGTIGRRECVGPLKAALSREKDDVIKKYLAEALSVCAGNSLLGERGAPDLSVLDASLLYSEGRTGWADGILGRRLQARSSAVTPVLLSHLLSVDGIVRLAAVQLLGAARSHPARPALEKLASGDPEEKVRNAARRALEELPVRVP